MKQCQKTISAASQDGIVKSDHLINTIRDMATELGCVYFLKDNCGIVCSTPPTSTLCSKTAHIRDSLSFPFRLECYLDTGSESVLPVSTLTIGGNVIVIDVCHKHHMEQEHLTTWGWLCSTHMQSHVSIDRGRWSRSYIKSQGLVCIRDSSRREGKSLHLALLTSAILNWR